MSAIRQIVISGLSSSLVTVALGIGVVTDLAAQEGQRSILVAQNKAPASDELFEVRYKFKVGEEIRWETSQEVTATTRISGQESYDRAWTQTVKVWRIREVTAEGNIVFEQSVESIDVSQSRGPGTEVKYNSKTDEKPPLIYEELAKSIGVPLAVVTIDPAGKVLKKEAIYQGSQMGLDDIAMPLAGKKIKIGEFWSTPSEFVAKQEDGDPYKIKLSKVYKLTSVANGIATIDLRTEVLTPVTDARLRSQLIQEMTAGTIRFDMQNGRLISKEVKWDENVIGFSGPQSEMDFHARFTEDLKGKSEVAPTATAEATKAPAVKIKPRDGAPVIRK